MWRAGCADYRLVLPSGQSSPGLLVEDKAGGCRRFHLQWLRHHPTGESGIRDELFDIGADTKIGFRENEPALAELPDFVAVV